MKNTLDLMGFEEFGGKMIGLIGVAGGKMAAINALTGLRAVGRSLHAWVVLQQVGIPQAWDAFDDSGKPKNPELEKRLKEVGHKVARFAYLLSNEHTLEFLEKWETAPANPGGSSSE